MNFTFNSESYGTTVEINFEATTLDEIRDMFDQFLRGAGFYFEDEEDVYTKPENIDTSEECVHETDIFIHEDDDIQEYKKPWVGLTDEEIKDILDCGRGGLVDIKKAEQILKDRNT
jgi:hypothetical protein